LGFEESALTRLRRYREEADSSLEETDDVLNGFCRPSDGAIPPR
jgi:hypothetical protein